MVIVTDVISFPVPKSEARSFDGLSNVFVNNPTALGIKWKASPATKKRKAIPKYRNANFFLDLTMMRMEKTMVVTM